MNLKFCFLFCMALCLCACVSDEPESTPVNPSESENFDFSTQKKINFSLSYGFENYKISFKVYTEYPYNEDGSVKENVNAVYGAYTDIHSKFESKFIVPAYATKLYVCSDYIGVPQCVEMEINNDNASYVYQDAQLSPAYRSSGHEGTCFNISNYKRNVNTSFNLYGIYNDYKSSTYIPSNKNVSIFSILSSSTIISENHTLGELMSTINTAFANKKNNSNLCASSEVTNLRIAKQVYVNGKIEDIIDAHVDINYLKALGSYSNAMGYYYYSSDKELTAAEIKALPKYLVYPRTTKGTPTSIIRARLQFFGENYDQPGVDDFPAGYTIGWILIPDIAGAGVDYLSSNASIDKVDNNISQAYHIQDRAIYSNKEANYKQNNGCITLYDPKTGKIVIGFEDQTFNKTENDHSFDDILFYVDVDPTIAVYDPERPVVPTPPVEEVLDSTTTRATVAFEDIWPYGGDYDMNDVVIEHTQTITYNQDNLIKKIVDNFKAVHNGAKIIDAFGFKINGNSVGNLVGEGLVKEENNQFIVWENFSEAIGKEATVTRTFENGVDKTYYDASLNLFIVPYYQAAAKKRYEVHLPYTKPTSWIDVNYLNTHADANYVVKGGLYPFAIRLEGVLNWSVPDERVSIGSANAYPNFGKWVESKGTQYTDWYLNKK